MISTTLREFLESSTIHGLVNISTAKTRSARATWVVIVVACFSLSIFMITNSHQDWEESPVSTTITTQPITDLEFPTVTVCPPRGSNTALNHLLGKVKDVNFTLEERNELLDISREIFLELPNTRYAKQIAGLVNVEHARSIVKGQASLPEIDANGEITIRSSELEGSLSSPCFGDLEGTSSNFNSRAQSFHYVLNLPSNIGELVGNGFLVVSVETQGNWTYILPDNRWQLYTESLTFLEAEEFCTNHSGHLASVVSQEEQNHLGRLVNEPVWLGGSRLSRDDPWKWFDGRPWTYENWGYGFWNNPGFDCAGMEFDGTWSDGFCDDPIPSYVAILQQGEKGVMNLC